MLRRVPLSEQVLKVMSFLSRKSHVSGEMVMEEVALKKAKSRTHRAGFTNRRRRPNLNRHWGVEREGERQEAREDFVTS